MFTTSSLNKRPMTSSKLKHENFSGRYWTKIEFLGSNLKMTYFSGIKNLISQSEKQFFS